jgi:hypothetical protein
MPPSVITEDETNWAIAQIDEVLHSVAAAASPGDS